MIKIKDCFKIIFDKPFLEALVIAIFYLVIISLSENELRTAAFLIIFLTVFLNRGEK